jgi:hypothetical protein
VLGRERDDQIAMSQNQGSAEYHQPAMRGLSKCSDGLFDFANVIEVNWGDLNPKRGCHPLKGTELAQRDGCGGIPNNRCAF